MDAPEVVASWRATHLVDKIPVMAAGEFFYFEVDGLEFGFHPANEGRNPVGASTVICLRVADLEGTRNRLLDIGCSMRCGPLVIEEGRQICQLTDPFGNAFGLDGL